MKHVHLIGIGGTGLSAIARVLLESGYTVSGSDMHLSALADALASAGAQIYLGHRAEHVNGAEIVVRSSAVPDDNVEVQAALSRGIKVVKRADFLGDLMAGKAGIAVAGAHGKTSTTAMVSWILLTIGLDPSFILGAVISGLGVNARAGCGTFFVIEADEYDRMFLGLNPEVAVITNIEHDHPDCYPTEKDFFDAFRSFIDRLLPGGVLIACGDDPGVQAILPYGHEQGHKIVTYGRQNPMNHYQAVQVRLDAQSGCYDFKVCYQEQIVASVSLRVPGLHSVLNACAALAVADQLGQPLAEAAKALSSYRGTERRFEIVGENKSITVISDYAHHPTEIRATLAAARTRFPGKEIWAVWQPHTYSRTRLFFESFAASFDDADHVLVMEVYAAREPVDPTFSGRQFLEAMRHPHAVFVAGVRDAASFLEESLEAGDVLVVLSAGDASQICSYILAA